MRFLRSVEIPDGCLWMHSIYARPRDWPERAFVVRVFVVLPAKYGANDAWPTTIVHGYDDLDGARSGLICQGLTRIARSPGDDPAVVETWL